VKLTAVAEESEFFENFRQLEHYFDSLNIDKSKKHKLLVAIEEILVNIIKYAYGKSDGDNVFEIAINKTGDKISIEIIDFGREFNPLNAKEPLLDLDVQNREVGGVGIYLVKQFADKMEYKRVDNKNILTLTFEDKRGYDV
jgi:anti-sigma regulatory factor (Ser/Thr protein kinase)